MMKTVCKDCINKKPSTDNLVNHLRKSFHAKYTLEVRDKIDAYVWSDCDICRLSLGKPAFFALRKHTVNYND